MDIKGVTQEIDSSLQKKMAEFLFEKVPNYRKIFERGGNDYEIGGYLFMNRFTTDILNEYKSNKESPLVTDFFDFVEECSKTTNMEVLNLVNVGIIEILYSTSELREEIKSRLGPISLSLFEGWSGLYR